MIKMCDSKQLDEIRTFIHDIYVVDEKYDAEVLNDLREISNWISKKTFDVFDKIQKLQVRLMKDMLEKEILNKENSKERVSL